MKKTICLVGIGLLLVSVVLVSCAPGQKTLITKSNVATLRGTWEGWTTFSSFQGKPVLTSMEINNDTVPIMGKIILNNLPQPIANIFPGTVLSASNNVTIDFANGEISDQGTLINHGGKNFVELTLYAGEKMKVNGWFYYYGAKGTMELTKK
ncbi:MAG TPA: hypothetical protein VLW47_01895 [Thermodesulfobacteriota bacterium]|jgi:hypothetical protein|nr:hypothetical protein [Thermodesulfobacteriota bacterium]